jgi:sporulation protein YlmC with PRC-barrel domain
MRNTMTSPMLEPLSQTNLEPVEPIEDIRGRKVRDRDHRDFGKVEDVYVDPSARRARFISVKSGDILGMGGTRHLVPVEALSIEGDDVVVNATTDEINRGPRIDPGRKDLDPEAPAVHQTGVNGSSPIVLEVYEHYAVRDPFWSTSYQTPRWH